MRDGEIKHKLSPAQVSVMRHKVTEPPYFGKFWDHFEPGTYYCAACETALFHSTDKFDSKTGWPTFKKPINEKDLQFKSEPGPDDKVEIRCKKCKSHLGYVIPNDPPYYRINSVCLTFVSHVVTKPDSIEGAPDSLTTPAGVPDAQDLPEREHVPERRGLSALFAAALLGLLLGGGMVFVYLTRFAAVPTPVATSTASVITPTTTIDSIDGTEPEPGGTDSEVLPTSPTPVEEPVDTAPIDSTNTAPDTATSTQ